MFRKEVAAGDAAAALPTAPAQSGAPAAVEPAADSWRVRLLGLDLDRITEADAIAVIVRGLKDGRGGSVVPANLDVLRKLTHRRELAVLFERADLAVADGMPLVWASRLQGTPLPERIAGSDLVWSLTAEAALRGKSVFLLGGAPGACEAAEERLTAVYPGARFAGHYCPPRGFEFDAQLIGRIREMLRQSSPDIVYVALGFPKQERLIAYLRSEFPATWFLGVGHSLSFVAGQTRRAPPWLSRIGLEWVHRLVHDPRRLAKRYLLQGIPFAVRLFAGAIAARVFRRERLLPAAAGSAPAVRDRVVFVQGSAERMRAELLAELLADD